MTGGLPFRGLVMTKRAVLSFTHDELDLLAACVEFEIADLERGVADPNWLRLHDLRAKLREQIPVDEALKVAEGEPDTWAMFTAAPVLAAEVRRLRSASACAHCGHPRSAHPGQAGMCTKCTCDEWRAR